MLNSAPIQKYWQGLKDLFNWMKGHLLLLLTALAWLLYSLFKREQNRAAIAEAQAVEAEKKGELKELAHETEQAEKQASDSRADYERLATKYRKSDQ
jgi:hypothetical protein